MRHAIAKPRALRTSAPVEASEPPRCSSETRGLCAVPSPVPRATFCVLPTAAPCATAELARDRCVVGVVRLVGVVRFDAVDDTEIRDAEAVAAGRVNVRWLSLVVLVGVLAAELLLVGVVFAALVGVGEPLADGDA